LIGYRHYNAVTKAISAISYIYATINTLYL